MVQKLTGEVVKTVEGGTVKDVVARRVVSYDFKCQSISWKIGNKIRTHIIRPNTITLDSNDRGLLVADDRVQADMRVFRA